MGGQRGNGGGKKKGGNPGVGIDFKKVKHKVGKRLPKAQNETDTNFKARNINLPSQNAITEDKGGIAVNYQNHTLKELLNQTAHYNEKSRKHALEGLKDLFTRHPEELRAHVGLFYTTVVTRVADQESSVRTALQDLLRGTVMPALDGAVLQPFMPAIMAHVCSAMTHLSIDVRDDALIFLDILMDHCPQLVAATHLAPCLLHFCDLLSSGHRGRSIRAQSMKALLKVVRALCGFLRRAFPQGAGSGGAASASSAAAAPGPGSAAGASAAAGPHTTLYRSRCAWPAKQAGTHTETAAAALAAGSREGGAGPGPGSLAAQKAAPGASAADSVDSSIAGLARRLLGLLSDAWPECAPGELSTSPELDQAQALVGLLNASISIVQNLLLPAGSGSLQAAGGSVAAGVAAQEARAKAAAALAPVAETILKRLVPHFPATMPAVKPQPLVLEALVQYNLQSCQLLASFLPLHMQLAQQAAEGAASGTPLKKSLLASIAASPAWVETLVRYYLGVLKGGVLVPAVGMLSESSTMEGQGVGGKSPGSGRAGTTDASSNTATVSAAYKLVLQGVETAVPVVHAEHAGALLGAVADFAARLPAHAANRAQCLQLQHGLMRAWQRGELWLDAGQVSSWLSGLPKLLWELGTSALDTSALCLRMLHDAARFSSAGGAEGTAAAAAPSPLAAALQQLQPQLAPLFAVRMPGRPAKKAKKGDQQQEGQVQADTLLPGPLSKLPEPLQQLAVDAMYHLGTLDPALLKAVVTAVQEQLLAPAVALRAVEILMIRLPDAPPVQAASLLLSLLFPPAHLLASSSNAKAGEEQGQQELLLREVDVVLRMVESYSPASAVLMMLGPRLKEVVGSGAGAGSTQPAALHLYSVLRLCRLAAEGGQAGCSLVAGSSHLPAWLPPAAPCLAAQLGLAAAGAGAAGMPPRVAQDTVLSLVSSQPELGPRVVQAVGEQAQGLLQGAAAGSKAGSAHSSSERAVQEGVAALASLATVLLKLQPAKPVLLQHSAAVRASLAVLTVTQKLPSHVSADTAVSGELTRLQHALTDTLGALG